MRYSRNRIAASAFCLLAAAVAPLYSCPAAAQEPPRIRIGGGAAGDLLVGGARDFLDGGLGGFLGLQYRLDAGDHLRFHIDGGWSALTDARDGSQQSGAENSVYTLLAEPRLIGHIGPLRPFIAPSIGILGVRWRFETGRAGGDDAGTDTGFAWGGNAGLAVAIGSEHPIEVGVEGRLIDAGEHEFARVPAPDGSGSAGFLRTDFGMMTVRVSVTVAL